jgi:glycosyltransferase involved in cell wall biosynthesis
MANNKKLNMLFVSIVFPPKSDSEGLQVAKYYKYLKNNLSLNIDVVTSSDNTLFMPIDVGLKKLASGFRQIIKISFFENKYVNFLQRKLNPSSLNYPDSKFRFFKQWKRVIKELKNKPDIIYSRSFPISSTIMAFHLQKELQVPWVLHLSDPWTVSPIHKLGKAKGWNDEMEKKCFNNASILSFTSLKTIEMYSRKYPEHVSKMVFFPNVFDLEDKILHQYTVKEKIKVVYTGGLIEARSPEYLFKAIMELNNQYPEIISDFEFIFAGALDRKNRLLFEQVIPSVKHLGLLPFKEALLLQQKADLLLVIDTPFKNTDDAIFFPSKLLDYMLIQRRILALTDKNSTTWDIVDGKLGNCYVHSDIENIKQFLIRSWKAWKQQNLEYFYNKNLDMNYSAETNANKLSNLFSKVINEQ